MKLISNKLNKINRNLLIQFLACVQPIFTVKIKEKSIEGKIKKDLLGN